MFAIFSTISTIGMITDSVDDVPVRERTTAKSEIIRQRRSGVINCRNYDDSRSVSRESSLSRSITNLSANTSSVTATSSDEESDYDSSCSSSTCTDSENDDEENSDNSESDNPLETARLSVIRKPSDRQPLNFHNLHGYNVVISGDGLTASRPYAHNEFNNAVVLTNRPLRNDELFEVTIEKMIDRWSGSIEIGTDIHKNR